MIRFIRLSFALALAVVSLAACNGNPAGQDVESAYLCANAECSIAGETDR